MMRKAEVLPSEETIVTPEMTCGLCALRIRHPPGTFALTPASLIALQALGTHRQLLNGSGLDWGSGTGCLAIAAARIPDVTRVVGLEIDDSNVSIARANAVHHGVGNKTTFLSSDSFEPRNPDDRAFLEQFVGTTSFLLANPPSSESDDGFGYRRAVLRGARRFLVPDGVVFLSVSFQYGQARVEQLCQEAPGFVHGGVLASTDCVPFDLSRPDLLHCLHLYAEEERRGGLEYTFQHPENPHEASISAQAALADFETTGSSPLTKWQTHLFIFKQK